MIWIVSSNIAGTEENLSARREYIRLVSQARVSPWQKRTAVTASKRYLNYYQCKSEKGEYGLFITAHIDEAFSILRATQNNKKTLFSINACQVSNMHKRKLLNAVKKRNPQSELYLARQEKRKDGKIVNYIDDFGTFGFPTTKSEREVFMRREKGLTQAIRRAFEKVTES